MTYNLRIGAVLKCGLNWVDAGGCCASSCSSCFVVVVLMHVAWCSLSNECCFFSTDETSLLTQHIYNKKGCDGKTRTQIYLDKGLL